MCSFTRSYTLQTCFATRAEIRAAFLRDTKRFHPTRFARRHRELYRVANEVFLRIKDAYYELAQPRRVLRTGRAQSMGPGLQESSSGRNPSTSNTPVTAPQRAVTPVALPQVAPATVAQRPSTQRPATVPPPSVNTRSVATHSGASRPTAPTRVPTPGDAEVAEGLVTALQMAEKRDWGAAMLLLQKLSISHPNDRAIQAYAHYIRGCEYQSVGDLAGARVEFQRALSLDESLDAARRAMSGLRASSSRGGADT